MREAGRLLARVHEIVEEAIRPGISTKYLDKIAYDAIIAAGAKPSFLGLYDYPATINASINEEVIHAIPSDRLLLEGDIISIDIGVLLNGFHSDAARTHPVGHISDEAQRIITVTRDSFYKGLNQAVVGNRVSDISHAIQKYSEENGYSLVREFTGHGIGKSLHEDPAVPNYGPPGRGSRLQAGMALAIEPMVCQGGHGVSILEDGWTVVTNDKKLSAHYENTIVITDNGPEILTLTSKERSLEVMGDICRV